METYNQMNPKPVNFKFGQYINQGFDMFKNNIGEHIVAYLLVFVMSIIPFCGLLAVGNFYKYCKKIREGKSADPGEIFNFDDFVPYLILQLIMMAGIFLIYIPMVFLIFPVAMISESNPEAAGPIMGILFMVLGLVIVFAILYLLAKAFYIPGLISLKGMKEVGETWKISKTMTKGNSVMIILFVLLTSIIGQLGAVLCVVGIILTLPLYYMMNYFAQEDGLAQITVNEINEIGNDSL